MNKALCSALLLLSIVFAPAHASLSDILDETFGSMVISGGPSVDLSSDGGVLTGGSLIVKNKVSNPEIISFTPPQAQAGCSGLKLVGGSFNIISRDEFIQLMRNVMSNAIGYFWQLGIESICPSCMNVLRALQDKMQDVNDLMSDSCALAKTLVDSTGVQNHFESWEKRAKPHIQAFADGISDFEISRREDGQSTPDKVADGDPDLARKEFSKNLVWYALNKSRVADEINPLWTNDQKAEFIEQMMSLYGTIVMRYEAGSDPTITFWESKLDVSDFIEGGMDTSSASGNTIGPDGPQQYRCVHVPTEEENCLDHAIIEAPIAGLAERFLYLMAGVEPIAVADGHITLADAGLDPTPGIIHKFRNNIALNGQEKAFANMNPFSAYTILRDFQMYSDSADNFAPILARLAATSTVTHVIGDINKTVVAAIRSQAMTSEEPALKQMKESIVNIREEIDKVNAKVEIEVAKVSQLYDAWLNVLYSTRGDARLRSQTN